MKLKRISSFFLALAIGTGMSCGNAYAAEKTQDGVKLTITADSTSYDTGDNITAAITLENNSDSDITDVSLEGAVPANYHLSEGNKAVLRATYVKSGDSLSSELVFIPDNKKSAKADKGTSAVRAEKTAGTVSSTAAAPENSTKVTSAENDDNTGSRNDSGFSSRFILLGIILLILCAAVIVIIRKGKGKGLLIIVCITSAGALKPVVTYAVSGTREISVTETVSVAEKELQLTAAVTFTMDVPDMQAAVEEYYQDNSEEIVSVQDLEETEEVFSEKEAIKFLADRGFTEYPLTYDYTMDGTYVDEAEASADSDEKHPMYQTFFIAEDGSIWTIFIVGRTIAANPASYNLESDADAQILVSESETLTSYTEMGNKLYTTVPKESAVILKVVDKITSQKINELTFEEVIGL